MSREVPEWIGATDDTPIPPRVKVRVFERCNGHCCECRVRIVGSISPEFDHVTAIANGGRNAESNIQLLCKPCHAAKTKGDVAEKSFLYRKRLRAIGIKKPRTIRAWRKFDGTPVYASRER